MSRVLGRGLRGHACMVVGEEGFERQHHHLLAGSGRVSPAQESQHQGHLPGSRDTPLLGITWKCAVRTMKAPMDFSSCDFTIGDFLRGWLMYEECGVVPMLLCGGIAAIPAERTFILWGTTARRRLRSRRAVVAGAPGHTWYIIHERMLHGL